MATFAKTIIRCWVDVTARRTPFFDVYTGENPAFWNSTDVEFQLAFGKGPASSGELLDVSDFSSISLDVKPLTSKTSAAYMEKTADAAAINSALTLEQWEAGDAAHVVIGFSYTEANLPLSGNDFADFWLVISAITNTLPAAHDTLGASVLRAWEDGIPAPDGPLQGGNIIPALAVYDGSGHYTLTVTQDRIYTWDKGANDTSVTNGTETVTDSGDNFTAQGATVRLNGTAGQAVTAVVRGQVYLTADESDARYLLKTSDTRITSTDNGVTYKVDVILVDGQPTISLTAVAGGGNALSITGQDGNPYNITVILVDGVPTLSVAAA